MLPAPTGSKVYPSQRWPSAFVFTLLSAALSQQQTEHGGCNTCGEGGCRKQTLCNPRPVRKEHTEGQRAPRNCSGLMFVPDVHSGDGTEGRGSAVSCSRRMGSESADIGKDTAFLRVSAWRRVCEASHPGVVLPSLVTLVL